MLYLLVDSSPLSGFYELSDGASGSLSNSSNSVFSECFCSPSAGTEQLTAAVGAPPLAPPPLRWEQYAS